MTDITGAYYQFNSPDEFYIMPDEGYDALWRHVGGADKELARLALTILKDMNNSFALHTVSLDGLMREENIKG